EGRIVGNFEIERAKENPTKCRIMITTTNLDWTRPLVSICLKMPDLQYPKEVPDKFITVSDWTQICLELWPPVADESPSDFAQRATRRCGYMAIEPKGANDANDARSPHEVLALYRNPAVTRSIRKSQAIWILSADPDKLQRALHEYHETLHTARYICSTPLGGILTQTVAGPLAEGIGGHLGRKRWLEEDDRGEEAPLTGAKQIVWDQRNVQGRPRNGLNPPVGAGGKVIVNPNERWYSC
ncbi:hypothetical protein M408DRAFT_329591, partial [Serendipita vermifera MAFF 305830]